MNMISLGKNSFGQKQNETMIPETRILKLVPKEKSEKVFSTTAACWSKGLPCQAGCSHQSGRRLLGTNGGSIWLWCCLAQPGALGP